MKLTIDRSALLAAVGRVRGCCDTDSTIPIISSVLLTADDQGLTIAATNMELSAVEMAPANIAFGGVTTVNGELLFNLAKRLPPGATLSLETGTGDALAVKAARSNSSLATLPPDDFPELGAGSLPHSFVISAPVLLGLLDRPRHAVSTEATRYYLNGICLHRHDALLRAVATDGHRLVRTEAPLPPGAEGLPQIIVPLRAVDELRKALASATGAVSVYVSDTRIRVTVGALTLTSKLIDGTFPEYERVIPRGNDISLRLPRASLLDAVGRVALIGDVRGIPLILQAGGNAVRLSASQPERGEISEEIDDDVSIGGAVRVAFNAKYLSDALGTLNGPEVEFSFRDNQAPGILRDPADDATLIVVMPVRA